MSGKQSGDDYDLRAVMAGSSIDAGVIGGDELCQFAEAVCANDRELTATARSAVVNTLGRAAMLDAAATIAAFNAFPRVADATGIPLEDAKAEATAALRADLGLEVFNPIGKHCVCLGQA